MEKKAVQWFLISNGLKVLHVLACTACCHTAEILYI
jgi:hypothetical protein